PDVVQAVVKPRSDRPDIAPLRRFDSVPADDEILEGAEGDHVLGEQEPRAGEIDRLHLFRQAAEPFPDEREVVGIEWRDHAVSSSLSASEYDASTNPSSLRKPG